MFCRKNLFFISLLLALSGCATLFRGTDQVVSVTSSPSGAVAEFSNGFTAITPCKIRAERAMPLELTISKEGYTPHKGSLLPIPSALGALGSRADYGTGAIYNLEPNPYHAILIPEESCPENKEELPGTPP